MIWSLFDTFSLFFHFNLITVSSSTFPHLSASAFCCHDSGATVLAMAPRHQLLITGGKKGWISILDLPYRHQRQSFQAHDSPVKALEVDPTEDCFISGSSEGNIRVFPTDARSVSVSDACSAEPVNVEVKAEPVHGQPDADASAAALLHTPTCRRRLQHICLKFN